MNGESGFNFADERRSEDETIAYAQCMTKMAGGNSTGTTLLPYGVFIGGRLLLKKSKLPI
jgi:hypothetical protein